MTVDGDTGRPRFFRPKEFLSKKVANQKAACTFSLSLCVLIDKKKKMIIFWLSLNTMNDRQHNPSLMKDPRGHPRHRPTFPKARDTEVRSREAAHPGVNKNFSRHLSYIFPRAFSLLAKQNASTTQPSPPQKIAYSLFVHRRRICSRRSRAMNQGKLIWGGEATTRWVDRAFSYALGARCASATAVNTNALLQAAFATCETM